jgi:hypothetical protein
MKCKSRLAGLSFTAALCFALAAPTAHASGYSFSQGGFSGGGAISGTFTGSDIDLDGQINSFAGEVTAFSLSFSGDSLVPAFTHGMADFYGLIYDVGSGFIGDGSTGGIEGMASNWGGTIGFDYASGLGPTGGLGGRVIDIATGATSSTPELISVVPEPSTYALFALGAAVLVGRKLTRRV